MNKKLWMKTLIASAAVAITLPAHALVLGTEVTINDQDPVYSGSAINEDNEAEPGMAQTQAWDLEGFFLNGTTLNMVGGYNFWTGEGTGWRGTDNTGWLAGDKLFNFGSGDLFISVGKPVYGAPGADNTGIVNGSSNGNVIEKNKYGYDYVFDLDFTRNSWNLYALDSQSEVITPYFSQNYQSNPWQFNAAGQVDEAGKTVAVASLGTGSIFGNQATTLTDIETGKSSWDANNNKHFVAGIDLSKLYAQLSQDETLFAHFTMECGNDNLMGSWVTTSVPEPATIALFSLGLCGLVASRRKKSKEA